MSVDSAASRPRVTQEPSGTAAWFSRQAKLAPYIFVSPFYILFFGFFLFPSLAAVVLSFFQWNGIGDPKWLGTRNFARIMQDPVFWQASFNTAIYMVASLFVVIPLALVLSVALNSRELGLRSIWRSTYFTPVVTSTVAIALVFSLLYSTDYGLINATLRAVNLPPVNWLGDTAWVKISIIVMIVWRWTGYTMIYFLAGMQGISQSLYEAAMIDGASGTQQFFHITIPQLRPVILYVSIIVLIGSVQIFDEPFILTSGGPANASLSVAQYLYTRGIGQLRFGYASTVGLIMFVVIFVLSIVNLRAFGVFRED